MAAPASHKTRKAMVTKDQPTVVLHQVVGGVRAPGFANRAPDWQYSARWGVRKDAEETT